MKACIHGLLAMLLTSNAAAYLVNFTNYLPLEGLRAAVYDTDCSTPLAGEAFQVQAYVGFTPGSLIPLGEPVPFLVQGYFRGGALVVAGAPGILVYLQVRAWEASSGASFEEAVAAGGKHGVSNVILVRPIPPPSPSDLLLGLKSFCLGEGAPSDRPSFVRADVVEDQIVMTIADPPTNQWMRIEGSRDLVTWTGLGNLLTTNRFRIAHGESLAAGPYRFYRLRTPGTSVEQARERWRSQGIDSYAYTMQYRVWGEQLGEYQARVTVVDGSKRVSDVIDDQGRPVSSYDPAEFPAIDELFDQLEEVLGAGVRSVAVWYDEERGFPVHVQIDQHEVRAREGWPDVVVGTVREYIITDVTIGAGQP